MGKALKTVGVIIGGAALIATGVGAFAMPALAGSTTLFGVSVGTLNTISSGLIAVGGLLDKPKSQGSASPDEWTSNPDQPVPFLMGRMGIAGKIVQRDEFGPDNMYQGIVGILSGAGPIRGVTGFAGDKQPVTFGANGIAVTSQWQGEMWMVRRSGAQPDTALTVPAGLKSGGSAFEWSPAAKLSGKACYLQVLGENSKGTAFPAGVPDPMHTAEGIFGYDPRYDDTYPGGAGPCRLGVRSTYRWIDNGGIGGLNWSLGLVENAQVVGGIGASIDGIDVPAFVEVANVADANSWKLAAWPDTSEDVSAVLDQLLQAAGAVRARHAGKISCVSRGAPRASVATITARDTAGDIELDTAPSLFNRLNTITPRFMSEAAGWVLTPANPVSFAQYVTDDGGKHSDQIDYRFVSSLKQAAELAAYDILDAREPFSGTIPLKAHMRHLKRGDTFDIDEPGFLMDGVKCIVLSRSYDPKTAQVRIGFRSETDSKHALALGKTTTLPDFPVLTPTDPTYVSPPLPADWVITPRPPAPGGGQLPGFDLSGVVSNDTATAIIVEYGLSATGPWKQAYQGPPTVTNIPLDGLQPGVQYWVAIQYQRNQNYSERHVYGPYTAPDLIAGDLSPESPVWTEIELQGVAITDVTDRLVGVEAITQTVQQGIDDLEEIFGDTVSAAASAASAADEASKAILARAASVEAKEQSVAAAGASASSASQAGGFKSDAEAASAAATAQKVAAQAARDEADARAAASAQSAANASASETEAGLQAAASQTARNAADAARGQAETYRNETASARDTAQGAAATATAQAGLSASSAGASQAAANTPLATSPALMPDAFLVNSWEALNGSPNLRQVYADNPGVIYPVGSTVEVNTYGAGFHLNTAKALPRPEGHRFRYSATVQRKVDAGTAEQNKVTLFAWFWDANGESLGGWEFYSVNPGTSSGAVTLTAEHAPPAGAAWTRTLVRIFSTVGVTAIVSLDTQDIESEKTATAAAAASVAGASVASTKADEAGASAAAADAAMVAAEIARDGASGSASASATSASQALAYRNQAGEFATSSSGSANQAATASGQSLAYRDQSAASSAEAVSAAARAGTSANNAGQSEYNAYQNYVGAAAAAATAVEQASTAGAHAASASISANLAASVGAPRGQLLYNSTGNQGMDGWAGGPNWYAQDIGYGFGRGFRCGTSGSFFYNDSAHFAGIAPESWVTWSADPQVFGGTCDLWLEFYDAALNRIGGSYAQRQVSNRDFGDPISGEVLAPAGAFNARLVVLPTFSSGGSAGVRRMKVERGRLPATAWSDEETTKALASQLNITAAVAADAQTRLANVIFEVIGAAGGDPFQLLFKAVGSNSLGQMVASALRFGNVIGGQIVDVMKLIGGSVFITGPLYIGPNKEIELNPLSSNPHISIKVGTGRMAFGKLPNDNLIYWFGPTQEVAAMRKNNATEWRDTLGNAYFGGSLAAGVLTARDRTSSLSVSAYVDTGRYGSNGGAITVTASLSGGWGKTYFSATNLAPASETGAIVVSLDRAINGGAFSNGVATMNRAYTWSRENQGFEPGQGYRIVENGSYGGAITYTDPQQIVQDRQYRARITSFSPITLAGPPTVQDLGVISVE